MIFSFIAPYVKNTFMNARFHGLQHLPEQQVKALHDLKELTGLTMTELSRRMIEHCLKEQVLNEVLPCLSGQLRLGS